MVLYVIGWLAIMVIFMITQLRFYRAHQKAHGWWRSFDTPWMFPTLHEARQMLRATREQDHDPLVEARRRAYAKIQLLAVAYLTVGFAVAVWLAS